MNGGIDMKNLTLAIMLASAWALKSPAADATLRGSCERECDIAYTGMDDTCKALDDNHDVGTCKNAAWQGHQACHGECHDKF